MEPQRLTALHHLATATRAVLSGDILKLFNVVACKEASSHRVAEGVAYGPNPRQRYDVYAPKGIVQRLPVIVFYYGGGWNSGARGDYAWVGRALAAQGYIVAVPDYRVVPEVVYPAFLEDCALALSHFAKAARHYGGDAARLAVIGHSAGAYNAMMLALAPFLAVEGVTIRAAVGLAGPYDFLPFDVPESIDAFSQWHRPEETQPITHVRKVETKFLLLHSHADRVVYDKNPLALHQHLRATGNAVTLTFYDGISHQDVAAALSLPFRWKAPVLKDVIAFLQAALS